MADLAAGARMAPAVAVSRSTRSILVGVRARVISFVLLALVAAPSAQAATADEKIANQVFTDYTKDGRIDPCDYTTAELETALDNVAPNIVQYASDYPAAIRRALRFRARGECDEDAAAPAAPAAPAPPAPAPGTSGGAAPAAPATSLPPTTPGVAAPPAPDAAVPAAAGAGPADTAVERAAAAAPDSDAPAPLVGLGLLAVLLAMLAAMLLTVRRLGRGEGRLAPAYHSWREARWRAGGVWADFRDWLSLGR